MSLTEDDKIWIKGLLDVALETQALTFAQSLEATETRLLTEFHKWASPIDMRLRSHSATLRALDLEQEALADRVTKLEGNAP